MSLPVFGDTLPEVCPKCAQKIGPWRFAGYHRVIDKNCWECMRCGYVHHEDPMDKRNARYTDVDHSP